MLFGRKREAEAMVDRITAPELLRRIGIDPTLFLLDVREAFEFQQGHIPGSHHIPLGSLAQRIQEIPRDREVVTICRSGARSQRALGFLLANGHTRVLNLEGGLMRWAGKLKGR